MLSYLRLAMSEFITNESGFVKQRTSLPVAWSVGILVMGAVLFGIPGTARADPRYCGTLSGCSDENYCHYRCQTVYDCEIHECPNVFTCECWTND